MSANLNPEKALIFRITHVDNLPWILDHGLHCRNSNEFDPNFVTIGNPDVISKRHTRKVELAPGGTLSDYVPFYFTPYSIMMLNIVTGHAGAPKREKQELVILVSSLYRLNDLGLPTLFTDRHAYPLFAKYSSDLADLGEIDWKLLQARDFKHDPNDPGKKERYQAEALVKDHVPIEALSGIGCYNEHTAESLRGQTAARGLELAIKVTPSWYF